jgi:hypothetical protein
VPRPCFAQPPDSPSGKICRDRNALRSLTARVIGRRTAGRLKAPAAIEGYLDMTRAAASLMGAVLALGILSQPGAAKAQPYAYPPERVDWMVGPGYFGFSGHPWAGPPFAWPTLKPTYGCYFTRARLKNAWRQVEVCS